VRGGGERLPQGTPEFFERGRARSVRQEVADAEGAFGRGEDVGVDVEVVRAVGVHLVELQGSQARLAVASFALPALQLRQRAADADQHRVLGHEQIEEVQQPPAAAERVVDDEVVATCGHAGHRAVEALGGAVDLVLETLVGEGAAAAHRVEGVHRQVEPGSVEDVEERAGDAAPPTGGAGMQRGIGVDEFDPYEELRKQKAEAEERFASECEGAVMTVLKDDGVYRHLSRFKSCSPPPGRG